MKLTAKLLRDNIGNKITWEKCYDRYRGGYNEYSGIIEDVKGKNVLISNDYYWIPDLENAKIIAKEKAL